jgi:hypothetical protein
MRAMWPIATGTILRLIPLFIVFAACLIYIIKTKAVEGFLASIGNILSIIGAFVSIGMTFLLVGGKVEPQMMGILSLGLQLLSLLAALLFALGFLLIVIRKKPSG